MRLPLIAQGALKIKYNTDDVINKINHHCQQKLKYLKCENSRRKEF